MPTGGNLIPVWPSASNNGICFIPLLFLQQSALFQAALAAFAKFEFVRVICACLFSFAFAFLGARFDFALVLGVGHGSEKIDSVLELRGRPNMTS